MSSTVYTFAEEDVPAIVSRYIEGCPVPAIPQGRNQLGTATQHLHTLLVGGRSGGRRGGRRGGREMKEEGGEMKEEGGMEGREERRRGGGREGEMDGGGRRE